MTGGGKKSCREQYQSRVEWDVNRVICISTGADNRKIDNNLNQANNKYILGSLRPSLTIVLKSNFKSINSRLKKRVNKNKFDKLNESFYTKIQRTFIKKSNNKNYYLFDTSNNDSIIENNILKIVLKRLNN